MPQPEKPVVYEHIHTDIKGNYTEVWFMWDNQPHKIAVWRDPAKGMTWQARDAQGKIITHVPPSVLKAVEGDLQLDQYKIVNHVN